MDELSRLKKDKYRWDCKATELCMIEYQLGNKGLLTHAVREVFDERMEGIDQTRRALKMQIRLEEKRLGLATQDDKRKAVLGVVRKEIGY